MKRVLPCLVRKACRASTRDFCPALAALVGPAKKNSAPYTISINLSPLPSKLRAGSRAGRLSFSLCLWSYRLQSEFMEKSRQFPQIHILNGHCYHKAFSVVKNVFCIQA